MFFFVTTALVKREFLDNHKIVDLMITKPWISSLNFSEDIQDVNEAAVKEMWNSRGTKTNFAGKTLAF